MSKPMQLTVRPANQNRRPQRRGFLGWLLSWRYHRASPSTFHRCLAVHMHFTQNRGGLK